MNLKPELETRLERVLASVEQLLPPAAAPLDWERTWAANWRRHSFAGYLEAVPQIEETRLDDLVGIDRQRRVVEDNTRQFLAGFPANNVLLWGSRGTGKSSLVRALLNTYASQGLRIVQVDKQDLPQLSDIFIRIGDQPYRFIQGGQLVGRGMVGSRHFPAVASRKGRPGLCLQLVERSSLHLPTLI